MSANNNTATIAIKATLTASKKCKPHKQTEEKRRFCGSFATFSELEAMICTVFASSLDENATKPITITYLDDEGDEIRISSDAEWMEAQRLRELSGEAGTTLKLNVKQSSAAIDSSSESSNSDSEEKKKDCPMRSFCRRGERHCRNAFQDPAKMMSCCFPAASGQGLVDLLHQCAALPPHFVNQAQRTCAADPQLAAASQLIINSTNALMDKQSYVQAERILKSALNGRFYSNATMAYNAACAIAQQAKQLYDQIHAAKKTADAVTAHQQTIKDRVDEAFTFLQRAMSLGFQKPALLASDPDLEFIRKDERFPALLTAMKTAAEQATHAAQAACGGESKRAPHTEHEAKDDNDDESSARAHPKEEQPKPAAAEAASHNPAMGNPVAMALTFMQAACPQLSPEVAQAVLKANNFDINAAVNAALGGQQQQQQQQ